MLPAGSRRSKIRPPRKSLGGAGGDASAEDFEQTWAVLAAAITQIQNKNVSNLLYEQLYRKAYVLVLRKQGARLYDSVARLVGDHLRERRTQVLASGGGGDFLRRLLAEWSEHLQLMKFVSDVLMYLNRVFVKEHKKLLIYDLGIQLFKEHVVEHEVGDRAVAIVIEEIAKSRRGEAITTKMHIVKVIGMMEVLEEAGGEGDSYYQTHFEARFLAASETFFHQLALHYARDNVSGTAYLHEVAQFIKDEEEGRARYYLPAATLPKLVDLMNNILIRDQIDAMMALPTEQQGMGFWMAPVARAVFAPEHGGGSRELALLYELVGRIDSERDLLKTRLREEVLRQGRALAATVTERVDGAAGSAFAVEWVNAVVAYQRELTRVVQQSFGGDYGVEQAASVAIQGFVNAGKRGAPALTAPAPELLSVYMDHYIKLFSRASAAADDLLLDEFIARALAFLRFITDKDAFEAHYANHFAKRFLNTKAAARPAKAAAVDTEELVLSKLIEEMGASSLDKVMRMSRDVKLSRDITAEWKRASPAAVELELKVCNVADWPKLMTRDYQVEAFPWPAALRPAIGAFEDYWRTGKKNDNKSLHWSPKFGLMDLRITYPSPPKTYDINLLTYAGTIMMLFAPQSRRDDGEPVLAFAERRQLRYEEIRELTRIPEADLKRQLQSIAVAPRLRLLIKVPMSKEVHPGDAFMLNDKFKAASAKVKVLTVALSKKREDRPAKTDADDEAAEVAANIAEGRNLEISAAVVRIMKSRQRLSHNELISELVRQLHYRFVPLTIQIKQRIEDLIQKEYLKRDAADKAIYHYVA
jgi:cullin 3